MARHKSKTKPRRRIKRSLTDRQSRPKARAKATPKKPSRKVAAKRGKAFARRKAATPAKPTSSRKSSVGKKATKRARRRVIFDPRLETAVKEMNRGSSLTSAARSVDLKPESLQSFVKQRRLAKRKGGRWAIKDTRLRRVPVITKGRVRIVTVRGYEQARLVGEHHNAAGNFVRTNDIQLIKPFDGRSVQAVKGKQHPLETDPNALHRIAAMDTPPFHEIYEIVSPT